VYKNITIIFKRLKKVVFLLNGDNMKESREREYERSILSQVSLIDRCVDEGNIGGFEKNVRHILDLLVSFGREAYGSEWKPTKPLKTVKDFSSLFDKGQLSEGLRQEALNRFIWIYTPESESYQNLRGALLSNEALIWIDSFDENARKVLLQRCSDPWIISYNQRVNSALRPADKARLSSLEEALFKHSDSGDVRRFETVAKMIVGSAKMGIENQRNLILGDKKLGRRKKKGEVTSVDREGLIRLYESWIRTYSPGSRAYEHLRELAGQNQYKRGMPPE
jgi:hypothetical protein